MKRVLFVDVRNATRSQMAEAWFNHLAGYRARAQSCGTLPAERISKRAVDVMLELGIDLRDHLPKPITQRMLDQVDLVVFMGSGIYPRVHNSVRVWDFQDSAGGSLDHVRELRDQICRRVEQLIAEIAREDALSAWMEWDTFLPRQLQQV
jgi:arsenate reductase